MEEKNKIPSPPPRSWPLRKKLLLFLLIIFLPGFGVIVSKGVKQRQAAILEAENKAFLLTESLAAQQAQLVTTTQTILTMLAERPEVQRLDAKACNRIFADLQRRYPFFTVFMAATPDGNVFADSISFGPTNLADRKYMKEIIATPAFTAGEYAIGKTSRQESIHFAYPVLDRNKNLIAVVIAGFNLSQFQRFVAKLNLPAGYAVVIADWKGLRLFRWPVDPRTPTGSPIVQSGLEQISGSQEYGFRDWESLDEAKRVYAFRQMRLREGLPPYLFVLVGIPKNHILHQADLQMLSNLLLLGGTALAAMALAWILGNKVLVKPLTNLVSATERFGAGDLKARTGLLYTSDELGKLAKSFDEMASLLERRNTERENAEEALHKVNAELRQNRQQLEDEVSRRTAQLRQSEAQLRRLHRALVTLSKCNEALVHATEEPVLLAKICEIIVDAGGYRMAWVTFIGEKPDDPLLPAAKAGFDEGYLASLNLTWAEVMRGVGAVGTAIQTGTPYVVRDIADNPKVAPWRDAARQRGYGSYIALPLLGASRGLGVLQIYASETDAFDQKEVELLKELADDLAYGIRSLRNEAERRRAEAAVRESEQRYHMLFARNPHPMWIYDMETLAFLEVNDAAVFHYGYSREEFLRMTIKDIRPPEEVPGILANVTKRDDGYDRNGAFRHCKKDGTIIHTEISRYAFVQDGRPVRLILANDVTERKRTEEELRRSEATLQLLVQNAPYGILRTASDGRVMDANPEIVNMLGYDSAAELLSVNLATAVYRKPEERAVLLERQRREGGFRKAEVGWKRKDGTPITVRISSHTYADAEGQLVSASFVDDVTEVRKLQEQLLQSQKLEAIGKLTGGIAHDFNNILMIINSYSEMALEKVDRQSPLRHSLEQISKAGDRAASLTRQLLAFSRKQARTPVVLNLATALSDLKEMLKRLIGEDVVLEVSLAKDIWSIQADPSQIQQVVFNLAVNARDAMPSGGKLTVRATNAELDDDFAQLHPGSKAGPCVALVVSDTGCGMSPEIQEHIFEPFFTTKEPGKGTGLGLSTVYGIVQQSDGCIIVESEPGKGTTFCIYLPRAGEPLPARKERVNAALARATVLVVEDEDPTREAIADYLQQNGFQVIAAASAQEALRRCEGTNEGVDVLLTDVVMPGMNGIDLARRFCAQHPQVRVVFMSGYTDDVLVRSGMSESEITLLPKPFRLPDLVGKLKGMLAGPAQS